MDSKPDREKALRDGFFDFRVQRSGICQRLRFRIVRENCVAGIIPFIVPDRIIDLPQLQLVCEQLQLPLKSAAGMLLPKGKMLHDFAGL